MRTFRAELDAKVGIVLPREVRERLKVGPGDAIVFEERDGSIVVRAARRPDDPFASFEEWSGEADEKAYADF